MVIRAEENTNTLPVHLLRDLLAKSMTSVPRSEMRNPISAGSSGQSIQARSTRECSFAIHGSTSRKHSSPDVHDSITLGPIIDLVGDMDAIEKAERRIEESLGFRYVNPKLALSTDLDRKLVPTPENWSTRSFGSEENVSKLVDNGGDECEEDSVPSKTDDANPVPFMREQAKERQDESSAFGSSTSSFSEFDAEGLPIEGVDCSIGSDIDDSDLLDLLESTKGDENATCDQKENRYPGVSEACSVITSSSPPPPKRPQSNQNRSRVRMLNK